MIPDKRAYQSNRRIMCYIALFLMAMTTVATIWDPVRMAHADGAIMTQYIALSGLVGAYFGFSRTTGSVSKTKKRSGDVEMTKYASQEAYQAALGNPNSFENLQMGGQGIMGGQPIRQYLMPLIGQINNQMEEEKKK